MGYELFEVLSAGLPVARQPVNRKIDGRANERRSSP
jgi:hypothetical protein